MSLKTIRKELGVSDDFIELWTARGNAGEGFHDRVRTGQPKKIPKDLEPKVKASLKRKREGSSNKVAKLLKTNYDIDVSKSTVQRFAHKAGLKSYVRPKKPRLALADKPKRLAFARAHLKDDDLWDVWWTDEKAVELDPEGRLVWAESREEVEPRETDLVPPTIRVWAGISRWGNSKIFRVPSFWDSPTYVNFLKMKAIPNLREISGGQFIFEQDGDGAHRGKVVKKFFQEEGIKGLDDLPAHSPDIPPIENEWKMLDDGLRDRSYKTLDGLWRAIRNEWKNISNEKIESLIDSVPNRLKEIIKLKGAITRY